MPEHKTPGIYIEEISKLPSSISSVETSIPAFIGYTEKAFLKESNDIHLKPFRINSLFEYEQYFGYADPEKDGVLLVSFDRDSAALATVDESRRSKYLMYYGLQLFFENGGRSCYIISVNNYENESGAVKIDSLMKGLEQAATVNEITLLIFPDSINLENAFDYYALHKAAIQQCAALKDRFVIMDVYRDPKNMDHWKYDIDFLRSSDLGEGTGQLRNAAVCFPRIYSNINFSYKKAGTHYDNEELVRIEGAAASTLGELKLADNKQYEQARIALMDLPMLLPVAGAIAGIYALVDDSRGVWKAPANISIARAIRPEFLLSNEEQQDLNIDLPTGRSINVIRSFPERDAAIVWGARTLAGIDNEWRYIPVRRFCMMVEESIKNAMEQFVFEPNDRNTWIRIRGIIENYLTIQWKAGALMGTTTQEAFFVRVGLGETMTQQDIQEGRLIGEIGLAVVRPAEFIVLRFGVKMCGEL